MGNKGAGRPRIYSVLGDKHKHTIECYDFEWQQLKIYYEKLKRERPKYYITKESKEWNH